MADNPPNFEAIRAQAKAINKLYGGKINIEEWTIGDEEVLKVVLTFKHFLPDWIKEGLKNKRITHDDVYHYEKYMK